MSVRFVQAMLKPVRHPGYWLAFVRCWRYQALALAGVLALLGGMTLGPLTSSASAAVALPATTATSVTFTASPNPAAEDTTVKLTASISAADGTKPAGTVQFEVDGTDIGSPAGITSLGTASTSTTFTSPGIENLSAVYTPTNSNYAGFTATYQEIVTGPYFNVEPVTVTVPASGSFILTVATGTVNLAVSGATATGVLNPVTVSDTRNTYPGWSVTGQASNFAGSGTAAGQTISGNQLGWVPTDTSLGTSVTLGATVTPASPGLGTTAATLASATPGHGFGTSALGANMTLDLPALAFAGSYSDTLTITAVTTGP
jgi:hypothetical protein